MSDKVSRPILLAMGCGNPAPDWSQYQDADLPPVPVDSADYYVGPDEGPGRDVRDVVQDIVDVFIGPDRVDVSDWLDAAETPGDAQIADGNSGDTHGPDEAGGDLHVGDDGTGEDVLDVGDEVDFSEALPDISDEDLGDHLVSGDDISTSPDDLAVDGEDGIDTGVEDLGAENVGADQDSGGTCTPVSSVEIYCDGADDDCDGDTDEGCIENITGGYLVLYGVGMAKSDFEDALNSQSPTPIIDVGVAFNGNPADGIMLCDFTEEAGVAGIIIPCTDEPVPIGEADALELDVAQLIPGQNIWTLKQGEISLATFVIVSEGAGYNAGLTIDLVGCSYLVNTFACQ